MKDNRDLGLVENSILCTENRIKGRFVDPAAGITVTKIEEK